MKTVGRLVYEMYAAISQEITTDEVIITQERIEHSNLHNSAYDRYGQYIPQVLSDPDFIFEDKKPNTAVLIRQIEENGKHVQLVLRLHIPQDDPWYRNSVISFWDISAARRRNYERNKNVIYTRRNP